MRRTLTALTALSFGVLLCSAAPAQTIVNVAPVDPLVSGLRDRVNELEGQVRTLTGDNERLTFEVQRAKEENTRLQRTIADMQTGGGVSVPAVNAPSPSQSAAAGRLGDLPASAVPPAPPAAASDAASAFDAAYDFIRKSDFAGAETAFRSFLATYPRDAKAPDARYYLGQTLLQRGAAGDAAEQFLTIVKSTPKATRAPEAMVRLGVALNRMGEKAQACATLQALPTQYPNAAAGVKASATAQVRAIGC